MTTATSGPTRRSTVRRKPRNARYDRASVDRVLDGGLIAHVSFVGDGQPYCIPMLYARVGERVLVHGSTASRMVRALSAGSPACLTVTRVDAWVLARSVFETGANYDSVMLLGHFRPLSGDDQKLAALEAFVEAILPGRWDEARPPTSQELNATAVLEMEIGEAAVKTKTGGPDDDESRDAQLPIWAGVLPVVTGYGPPQPSPALRPGTPLPPSVRGLLAGCGSRPDGLGGRVAGQ
jgi:nitroimidazol reductase NimA-like FMN-containing flavoprotein (pyridoxamine 5'-phosphate oxidase superfamily)